MDFPAYSAQSLLPPASLGLLLLWAAWSDWKSRRIPNVLVLYGSLAGLALHAVLGGGHGLLQSLSGWGAGLLVLLPFYLLRMLGAGDVKLMAMVGSFLGPAAVPGLLALTLLLGGLLALLMAARQGRLMRLGRNLREMVLGLFFKLAQQKLPMPDHPGPASVGSMPYGVAIAGAALAYLALAGRGVIAWLGL